MNIQKMFLTPNQYSRPQRPLEVVKGIVVHWVANPMTSAIANRNFFENRKYGKTDYGSTQYIVGLQGEILQLMPELEMAYAVGSNTYTAEALRCLGNYPNSTTINIECTHIDWNGNMTKETYDAVVELCAYLLKKYELCANDLWLHKTVVGWKDCHFFFVKNPNEWQKFKDAVACKMNPAAVEPVLQGITCQVNGKEYMAIYKQDRTHIIWTCVRDLNIPHQYLGNDMFTISGRKVKGIIHEGNVYLDWTTITDGKLTPVHLADGRINFVYQANYIPVYETHTVVAGDTLWKIATQYGVSVQQLKALNGMTSDNLSIGQMLKTKLDWKSAIIEDAKQKGIISNYHNPDDISLKSFTLATILNALGIKYSYENVILKSEEIGIISKAQHQADEIADKWFVLAVAMNAKKVHVDYTTHANWQDAIMAKAKETALITSDHNPEDVASKWFSLAIAMKVN